MRSSHSLFILFSISFILFSCLESNSKKSSNSTTQKSTSETYMDVNPPAKGFNLEASDSKAISIADEVMLAMGGRAAYDSTRYLTWNFFGSRKHVWDKETGNIYINNLRDQYELRMNIHDMTGMMYIDGEEMVQQDTIKKYLTRGKEMWINDAYWLVMPYKLKDSGVTLKYLGADTTATGKAAEKLELTFADVGVTPDNKYHVYVDKQLNLITQWDFFTSYDDPEPRFSTPWEGYKNYNGILLSGGRGKNSLTEIEASESLKSYFNQ